MAYVVSGMPQYRAECVGEFYVLVDPKSLLTRALATTKVVVHGVLTQAVRMT